MRHLSATDTSKLIRKQLKATFPAVKFSVTTKSHGTINVRWTDGPTAKRVEEIAGQYEGKGFDGSIDLAYYINGWMLNGEIIGYQTRGTEGSMGTVPASGLIPPHDDAELVDFGAGYIFCSREISPALARRCALQIQSYYGHPMPEVVEFTHHDGSKGWRIDADSRQVMGEYPSTLIYQASTDATRFAPKVWT